MRFLLCIPAVVLETNSTNESPERRRWRLKVGGARRWKWLASSRHEAVGFKQQRKRKPEGRWKDCMKEDSTAARQKECTLDRAVWRRNTNLLDT